jgi:hypothetical protein
VLKLTVAPCLAYLDPPVVAQLRQNVADLIISYSLGFG